MSLFESLGLNLDIAKASITPEEAKAVLKAALDAIEKDKANLTLLGNILSFAKLLANV